MEIYEISEFFYLKAALRIKNKIEKDHLTYKKIYPPDPKQISQIVHNKRNPKKNRYLIRDAVIDGLYYNKETKESEICGLLHTLSFKTKKEILWGTDTEIKLYLSDLFALLFENATDPDSPYNLDKELYLCDYIPYAMYSSYWHILFESNNKFIAMYYSITEDTVTKEITPARETAILFLYNKCRKKFLENFLAFTNKESSFNQIDKKIEKFIKNDFVPMLKELSPNETSLGLRVKNLILSDLSHCAPLVASGKRDNYYTPLIRASSTYIQKLKYIQLFNSI